jgi:hypothetical protein
MEIRCTRGKAPKDWSLCLPDVGAFSGYHCAPWIGGPNTAWWTGCIALNCVNGQPRYVECRMPWIVGYANIERLGNGMIAGIGGIVASRAGAIHSGQTRKVIQARNARDGNGQCVEQNLSSGHGLSRRRLGPVPSQICPGTLKSKRRRIERSSGRVQSKWIVDADVKRLRTQWRWAARSPSRGQITGSIVPRLRRKERSLETQ